SGAVGRGFGSCDGGGDVPLPTGPLVQISRCDFQITAHVISLSYSRLAQKSGLLSIRGDGVVRRTGPPDLSSVTGSVMRHAREAIHRMRQGCRHRGYLVRECHCRPFDRHRFERDGYWDLQGKEGLGAADDGPCLLELPGFGIQHVLDSFVRLGHLLGALLLFDISVGVGRGGLPGPALWRLRVVQRRACGSETLGALVKSM